MSHTPGDFGLTPPPAPGERPPDDVSSGGSTGGSSGGSASPSGGHGAGNWYPPPWPGPGFAPPAGWTPPLSGGFGPGGFGPGGFTPAGFGPGGGYSPPRRPAPIPPAGSARGSFMAGMMAWVAIAIAVAAIVFKSSWTPDRWSAHKDAATQPATPIEIVYSSRLKMVSRYAVGAKQLMGQQAAVMARQVEDQAANPIDEFRTIPVIAELRGADAALERLDQFEDEHEVVRLREDVDTLRGLYTDGQSALSDTQRQRLIARHGWFGELAGSWSLPETDPRRKSALAPARRTLITMMSVMMVAGMALLAGIALSIVAIIMLARGTLYRAYPRPDPTSSSSVFAEAFALYLLGMIGVSVGITLWVPDPGIASSFLLIPTVPLALLWMRLRGVGWGEMRYGLGLHAGGGFLREVGSGVVGYIAGLPILGIGMLISFFLISHFGQPGQGGHPIQDMPIESARDVIQLLLLASVMAPVLEEMMFRGALFHHLRRKFGWLVSSLIVSLVFAAIHPQGWMAIPALGSVAIVLAGLREWRGSIIASMAAHALNNGVIVLIMALTMS